MLTWEDDVEAHALRRQGWTISAIARHLRRDRKTIREYLKGNRTPGERARYRGIPGLHVQVRIGTVRGFRRLGPSGVRPTGTDLDAPQGRPTMPIHPVVVRGCSERS